MASFNDTQRVFTLRWRCRRGMKELDLLLTRYLERDYYGSTTEQQQAFEKLLELSDPEILDFILGKAVPDSPDLDYVVSRLTVPGA